MKSLFMFLFLDGYHLNRFFNIHLLFSISLLCSPHLVSSSSVHEEQCCEAHTHWMKTQSKKWKWKSLSRVQLFGTPWMYSPWNSPGQDTGVGNCSLLQGIFRSPPLQILYQPSHQGSPRILEWVAYPFSSGLLWPRNRTRVSFIAGGFFTNWAIREPH